MKNLWKSLFLLMTAVLLLASCGKETGRSPALPAVKGGYVLNEDVENINDYLDYTNSDLKKIYFAGGFFWALKLLWIVFTA